MKNTNDLELIVRGVTVRDDKILLCKNLSEGHYFLPGGHIEKNESREAALKREMVEELSCEPTKLKFIAEVKNSFVQKGKEHEEIFYIFLVVFDNNFEFKGREKHIAFEWIQLNKLTSINFKPQKIADQLISIVELNADFWKQYRHFYGKQN